MLKTLYKLFLNSFGISTDTRTLKENQIYFALKGENFDGNKYAEQAIEKGALCVVVDDASILINKQDKPYFLVSDVLDTLQRLAKYHREILNIPILGITGSNGKTTTKELCYAVLSQKYNVFATQGNLNNHIGVPLSILSITDEHNFAIIEMGANHRKEIGELCEIALPNYGVITNIGSAHLEGFGSLEGVKKTKKELFDFVSNKQGVFFYPTEDKNISSFAESYDKSKSYSHSKLDAFVHYSVLKTELFSLVQIGDLQIQSKLFGEYNAQNMACAYTIGTYFGIEHEKIKYGIEHYIPTNNRSQLLKTQNNSLVVDAYNANPTSLTFAIQSFINLNGDSKILILGDMFELGEYALNEHQKIVDLLDEFVHKFEKVFLVGSIFFNTQIKNTERIHAINSRKELELLIQEFNYKGKTILLKGSRGIGLEKIIEFL